MTSRGARAVRGGAIAAFATFVASLAHVVGGGAAPSPLAVLVALALSLPLAVLLAGGRARLVRTSISALTAQAALHLCYALGGPAATPSVVAGAHAGHGTTVNLDGLLAAPVVDHGHALMPIAHVLAAALTVAALAVADDVSDAICRSVLLFVRRLTTMPVPAIAARFCNAAPVAPLRLIGALRYATLGSRGPPAAAAS